MVEDPAGLVVPMITIVDQADGNTDGSRVQARDQLDDILPALEVSRRLQRHPWRRSLEDLCKALAVLKFCIASRCKPESCTHLPCLSLEVLLVALNVSIVRRGLRAPADGLGDMGGRRGRGPCVAPGGMGWCGEGVALSCLLPLAAHRRGNRRGAHSRRSHMMLLARAREWREREGDDTS